MQEDFGEHFKALRQELDKIWGHLSKVEADKKILTLVVVVAKVQDKIAALEQKFKEQDMVNERFRHVSDMIFNLQELLDELLVKADAANAAS